MYFLEKYLIFSCYLPYLIPIATQLQKSIVQHNVDLVSLRRPALRTFVPRQRERNKRARLMGFETAGLPMHLPLLTLRRAMAELEINSVNKPRCRNPVLLSEAGRDALHPECLADGAPTIVTDDFPPAPLESIIITPETKVHDVVWR